MAGKRQVRTERRAARVARTTWAGHGAQLPPSTPAPDGHAGQTSGEHQGSPSSPTVQHPRVAPAPPRASLAPPLIRACQHPTHRHVAPLVAYELRRQRTARGRRAKGHARHLGLSAAGEARRRPYASRAHQPAPPGLATEGPRERARERISNLPPRLAPAGDPSGADKDARLGSTWRASPSVPRRAPWSKERASEARLHQPSRAHVSRRQSHRPVYAPPGRLRGPSLQQEARARPCEPPPHQQV